MPARWFKELIVVTVGNLATTAPNAKVLRMQVCAVIETCCRFGQKSGVVPEEEP
jgi:hypothetical protein